MRPRSGDDVERSGAQVGHPEPAGQRNHLQQRLRRRRGCLGQVGDAAPVVEFIEDAYLARVVPGDPGGAFDSGGSLARDESAREV